MNDGFCRLSITGTWDFCVTWSSNMARRKRALCKSHRLSYLYVSPFPKLKTHTWCWSRIQSTLRRSILRTNSFSKSISTGAPLLPLEYPQILLSWRSPNAATTLFPGPPRKLKVPSTFPASSSRLPIGYICAELTLGQNHMRNRDYARKNWQS